jgi:hypothetical protein
MSPYRTRLQVKLAANAAPIKDANVANIEPAPKKYNTRLQAAILKERTEMKVLMEGVNPKNDDHAHIDSMRACFEYLQTGQTMWRNHPKFRAAVYDKTHDMLIHQIPIKLNRCAPDSETANKVAQLRSAIEKLREIMNNYYTQQYYMYDN